MERVRGAQIQSAKENIIIHLNIDDRHAKQLRDIVNQKESIYRVVFQRLFEEEVTEELLTILGHLVLLWFTGDKHTHTHTECIGSMYCIYKK